MTKTRGAHTRAPCFVLICMHPLSLFACESLLTDVALCFVTLYHCLTQATALVSPTNFSFPLSN